MRRWHQLRNYVFRIFSSLFQYPSTRPNWGKIGFECENIAVYCKIWAFRAAKFRSPLQIFGIFFANFRVDPSLLTPEKKVLRGWFKSNLQDKKAVSKRVQDTIQPTEYEHSSMNTSPLKSKDWYFLRTTNVMQQQIPTFLKTQDMFSWSNRKSSPKDYHSNGDKNFAWTQIDFPSTIFAMETDLGFTAPEDHSGNRIFFVRFAVLRTTEFTCITHPQIRFTRDVNIYLCWKTLNLGSK